jgi:hypothetical protein
MSWTKRRKVLAGFVGVFAALALGYGIAAFTLSVPFTGGNSGGAKTVGGPVGVIAGLTPTLAEQTTALSPGQTGSLYIRVNNSAPGAQVLHLVSWTPDASVNVITSDGTCTNANFTTPTVTGLSVVVPTGVNVIALPGAIGLIANPAPGCSNASLSLSGVAVFGF